MSGPVPELADESGAPLMFTLLNFHEKPVLNNFNWQARTALLYVRFFLHCSSCKRTTCKMIHASM